MNRLLTTLILAGSASLAQADMATRTVDYHIDGEVFQGLLVYDDSVTAPRPGLLMVPNWMGVTENAAKKAWRAAGSGVVSFHGNLDTGLPAKPGAVKSPVLVLHGADDPYVPPQQVADFEAEMRNAGTDDWQLLSFGGAVHSFTDPTANLPGQAMYDARVADRAFRQMRLFFAETMALPVPDTSR